MLWLARRPLQFHEELNNHIEDCLDGTPQFDLVADRFYGAATTKVSYLDFGDDADMGVFPADTELRPTHTERGVHGTRGTPKAEYFQESFLQLQLGIGRGTLVQAFEEYCDGELADLVPDQEGQDPEDEIDVLIKKVDGKKSISFDELPPTMCIHLRRIEIDEEKMAAMQARCFGRPATRTPRRRCTAAPRIITPCTTLIPVRINLTPQT